MYNAEAPPVRLELAIEIPSSSSGVDSCTRHTLEAMTVVQTLSSLDDSPFPTSSVSIFDLPLPPVGRVLATASHTLLLSTSYFQVACYSSTQSPTGAQCTNLLPSSVTFSIRIVTGNLAILAVFACWPFPTAFRFSMPARLASMGHTMLLTYRRPCC